MKKEEILEASKKENKKKDMYEMQVATKGCEYAAISMLLLAFVFFVYEIATERGSNPAFYSLITLFNAVSFGYKGIKIEKNRKANIFNSIVWGILTVMLCLEYFKVI